MGFISASSAYQASSATVVTPAPAAISSGNRLIAFCYNADNSGVTFTPPSGWTLIGGGDDGGGDAVNSIQAFERLATGSEPSTYTFTSSDGFFNAVDIVNYEPCLVDGWNVTVDDTFSPPLWQSTLLTVANSGDQVLLGIGNFNGAGVVGSTTPATEVLVRNDHPINLALDVLAGFSPTTTVPVFSGYAGSGGSLVMVVALTGGTPPEPLALAALIDTTTGDSLEFLINPDWQPLIHEVGKFYYPIGANVIAFGEKQSDGTRGISGRVLIHTFTDADFAMATTLVQSVNQLVLILPTGDSWNIMWNPTTNRQGAKPFRMMGWLPVNTFTAEYVQES